MSDFEVPIHSEPADPKVRKRNWRPALLASRHARRIGGNSATSKMVLGNHLEDLVIPVLKPGEAVATYLPFGSEPDVESFTNRLASLGIPVLVPDLSIPPGGPRLPFRLEHEGEVLRENTKGQSRIGAVIVPALALGSDGTRLGRGGGWYDRALRWFTNGNGDGPAPILVGVCFDSEFFNEGVLPSESHDKTVDYVVTEKRIVCVNKGVCVDTDAL